MFNSCKGLQISDGNFYNVSGDLNLGIHQELLVQASSADPHLSATDEEAPTPGVGGMDHSIAPINIMVPNVNARDTGLDTLHRHAALEALHDSVESFPQPRCHLETRIELLQKLKDMLHDSNGRVVWLHGPAGAGKSAIMETLSQQLQDAGNLGGTFFFKRGHPTRGNARVLFVTLAYQLALFFPAAKALILEPIRRKPLVVGTSIASQLRELIVEPCRRVTDSTGSPRILLIDGLDECDGSAVQQEILRSIRHIFCEHNLPVKIIIASRPEPEIQEIFKDPSFQGLDSVNIEQSFKDVELFLQKEFARIHSEHRETMADVPLPWPSSDIIESLVNLSSGYFIYAATVIKIIDDKQFRPTEQLQIVLNPTPDSEDYPFGSLDKLYIQILAQVPTRFRPQLLDILSVVAARWNLSPRHIEQLLDYKAGDVPLILRKLHSVLVIGGQDYAVRVTHASFLDFLENEMRSGFFCTGGVQRRIALARAILKAMSFTQLPDHDHVARRLTEFWINFITSIEPRFVGAAELLRFIRDLLRFIRDVNLDFVFLIKHSYGNSSVKRLISWMKNVSGVPEDLIDLWERVRWVDHFLLLDFTRRTHSAAVKSALQNLLLRNPQLQRILGVADLIGENPYSQTGPLLYKTRLLLDLSWDDIMASVWEIRPLADRDEICNPRPVYSTVQLAPSADVSKDIALGLIRLLRRIGNRELHTTILRHMEMDCRWGRLISAQLSDVEVFNQLRELGLPSVVSANPSCPLDPYDFSTVLAALKAHDGCPSELVDRWNAYHQESRQLMRNYVKEEEGLFFAQDGVLSPRRSTTVFRI
ncbi:hypothetical protein FB45DRAFT_1135256 [Roridomyces roridus]|uniref:NACHT domain-containing protein n=1 Tax=Roridomyces roridus TaxID=1738132 RepID=A0AAD7C5U8_9AGAR|nr:hypothetical protein FB45DRAFT_1135256 [Roridomyces roridus]